AEQIGNEVNAYCTCFFDSTLTDPSVARNAEATGRSAEEARAEQAAQNPSGRLIPPEEVAAAILALLREDGTGREVAIG
ncbi:MAG: 3-hydroxyacyl-CoA dehydrogenase, partial [Planctomycetota bacterium]